MRDHMVIVGSPKNGAERYFTRLLGRLRSEPGLAALAGPSPAELNRIIQRHVEPMVERAMQPAMPVLTARRDAVQIERLRAALTEAAVIEALVPLDDSAFNREREVALEDLFLNRMVPEPDARHGRPPPGNG